MHLFLAMAVNVCFRASSVLVHAELFVVSLSFEFVLHPLTIFRGHARLLLVTAAFQGSFDLNMHVLRSPSLNFYTKSIPKSKQAMFDNGVFGFLPICASKGENFVTPCGVILSVFVISATSEAILYGVFV